MPKAITKSITVKNLTINIKTSKSNDDFICLTDMAKFKGDETGIIIANWLTTKFTIQFLGLWEEMNNPNFNLMEFHKIKNEAGTNGFIVSSSKWIDSTNAIGIRSSSGRYGGTFAHKDIAFEFASWLSPEFKLYFIKEFQRLKEDESNRLNLEWNLQRTLSKINYQIHTDAIKETLIPPTISKKQTSIIYASEADLLNVALFGKTSAEFKNENPKFDGNLRDNATLEQLVILTNLESINSVLIRQNLPQGERLRKLNETAIVQMKSLLGSNQLQNQLKRLA